MKNVSVENYPVDGPGMGRRAAWLMLVILALLALLVVLTPAWLIQPFRPQSQRGLAVSYSLRQWSPVLTLAASVVALALVVWLWRGARRWWLKSILVAMLVLAFGATWFARQNHFEWMFNPLANAAYARAGEADFLTDTDMVLAIEVNGEAAAYPVRLMAYHHLVQDTVGGTPIVATY
jgi:glucan phosphoethanolaminetransferase (alkaline phosphatase superfamily)